MDQVHFDPRGNYTACGLSVHLSDVQLTRKLREVVCSRCDTAIMIAMSRSPR